MSAKNADKYVLVPSSAVKASFATALLGEKSRNDAGKDDAADTKSDVKDGNVDKTKPRALLRNRLKSSVKGGRLNPVSTWLTVVGSMVGSTATAYNTVINLEPDNTGEFSSFANLYDECKMDEFKMEFCSMRSASAGADTLISLAGMAYDPVDSGAYSAISTLAEASHHIIFKLPQVSATVDTERATSKRGLQTWHVKLPKGASYVNNAGNNVMVGQWSSTAESNVRYGYIKPYLEAGATGASWTIRYVLYMRVSFRSRT